MIKKNSISVLGHHNTHTPLHSNHGIDSHTIRDSMQYYRVWIYSCNSVLGVTSAIFTVVAAFVLADVRLSLLRDVELYHPTFLYAYTALILQCGVIQAIGCLGAQRLNHKLLSIYWVLLLLLTIGDVVVGLVWVFKLDKVKLDLRPALTDEFMRRYSADAGFTQLWNRYQEQEHCCGVNSPLDFNRFSPDVRSQLFNGHGFERSSEVTGLPILNLPESCCTMRADLLPLPINIPLSSQSTSHLRGQTRKRDIGRIQSSESLTSSLTASLSGEDTLNGLPSLVGTKMRHYHNRIKVPPHWTFAHNSSLGWGAVNASDSFTFHVADGSGFQVVDPGVGVGVSVTTEEPEVTEIKVPFTCRSPEKHFVPNALTLPVSRVYRTTLDKFDDTEESLESGSGFLRSSDDQDTEEAKRPNRAVDASNNPYRQEPPGTQTPTNRYHHPAPQNEIRVYRNGCVLKLLQWLDHVSGILFILGFCIIGFIKVCFLIILRYEIREMIEKIHILELDAKSVGMISPARSRGGSLGGNMLLKQYSTQSGGPAQQTIPPFTGITIKSPQGDTANYCPLPTNHVSSHHYLHHYQPHGARGARRPSARSLGEGIRSTSHSQETVNLTLLITASNGAESGASDCSIRNEADAETISLKVPTPEEREAKRNNFANYCTWESNVSADSSASGAYCSSYDHCCCPAEAGTVACSAHAQHPPFNGRTQVVHVELENCNTNPNSSFEDRSSQGSMRRDETIDEAPYEEEQALVAATNPTRANGMDSVIQMPGEHGPELNWAQATRCDEDEALLVNSTSIARIPLQRRNGNNNSTNTSLDLDSDFVMALIGTAV